MRTYKNLNSVKAVTKIALRRRYISSHLFLEGFWVPIKLAYALNIFSE
jgi:hypothetical protein